MLALAFPGTSPSWWEDQDDRYIATALDVLHERTNR